MDEVEADGEAATGPGLEAELTEDAALLQQSAVWLTRQILEDIEIRKLNYFPNIDYRLDISSKSMLARLQGLPECQCCQRIVCPPAQGCRL